MGWFLGLVTSDWGIGVPFVYVAWHCYIGRVTIDNYMQTDSLDFLLNEQSGLGRSKVGRPPAPAHAQFEGQVRSGRQMKEGGLSQVEGTA